MRSRYSTSTNDAVRIPAHPGLLTSNSDDSKEVEIVYNDIKTIGSGSFGVVYQAKLREPTQEQIAIKKVLQDKRFKNRELQIMRRLDHCNVVKLKYYFHTVGDRNSQEVYLNLVLEFMPETLNKIARTFSRHRNQNVPMELVKLYMYQLFRSLNYIHSMDICHRDIKPQNLLLNPQTGVLKLCDFGSAKSLVSGEPNVAYICSRYYRAPELIFGATDYTTKIDIWSAGCVMAELLLGEPMFPGGNGVDQLVEIIKILGTPRREEMRAMNQNYVEFKFPPIRSRPWDKVFTNGRAPPEASSLVSKLLEYTPSRRLTPLQACAHPFFDDLRSPNAAHIINEDRPLPPLFNFSEQELAKEPQLAPRLIPSHISDNSSSLLHRAFEATTRTPSTTTTTASTTAVAPQLITTTTTPTTSHRPIATTVTSTPTAVASQLNTTATTSATSNRPIATTVTSSTPTTTTKTGLTQAQADADCSDAAI